MVDYKVIPSSTSVRKQLTSLGWSAVCPPGPRAPRELAVHAPFTMWYKPQELGGCEGELGIQAACENVAKSDLETLFQIVPCQPKILIRANMEN